MRARERRALRLVIATVFALLVAAPAANAAVFPGVSTNMPSNVTAGQQDLPGSMTIVNNATAPHDVGPMTITQIRLTPACGSNSSPCGMPDPGVLSIDSPAIGRAGSACAGFTFTVAIQDAPTGRFGFTPSATVSVTKGGLPCIIDFTFDVLKVPTIDAEPPTPDSIQTIRVAEVLGTHDGSGQQGSAGQGNAYTVNKASPTVSIAAAATGSSLSPIGAAATVAGGVASPGGTMTFNVWGPDNLTCVGPPDRTDTEPVSAAAAAGSVIAGPPGDYRWIASYSGDANNDPATTVCNDPNSLTAVGPPLAGPGSTATTTPAETGQRAAALKKCKKKKTKKARKKCRKRAKLLPE
jgi:hypothetical protein